ncbi:primosomal protein N' [candidate division KSB1 bacterium]|nr:MAG: primosomal protein N' [candidate division KSB1 bacterium]
MTSMKNPDTSHYAEIVFPLPIDHSFTYLIPPQFSTILKPGFRVLAPFGRRKLTGFVVKLKQQTDLTDLKEIEDVLDEEPIFSPELLQLTEWISKYYLAPWGEVLNAALPAGINLESKRRVILSSDLDTETISQLQDISKNQRKILLLLARQTLVESASHKKPPRGGLHVHQLQKKLGTTNLYHNLTVLRQKGYVDIQSVISRPKVRIKTRKYVELSSAWQVPERLNAEIENLLKKHPRQAEILKFFQQHPEGDFQNDLLRKTNASLSSLNALQKRGIIQIHTREVMRDYYADQAIEQPPSLILNPDQQRVVQEICEAIEKGQYQTFLLYGVTGSGKTQVYITAISQVLECGKTAIVLVPEISLTSQIVGRFKGYFQDKVAVLHSRMSAGERYDSWRKIRQGEFKIVIGPRSAIFAPLQNIGLIVVDEEQEASYKQYDSSPRYHARDVAVMRAKINNAVAVLGSATPSVESYYNAERKKYTLLSLPSRIDDIPLPKVEIVDMAEEWKQRRQSTSFVFSKRLLEKIAEKITRREQVILLQNRRGFSSCLVCRDCGFIERCENCNITLTYHLKGRRLLCHYCDFHKPAPETCPNCGGINIKYSGVGTQRVEEELKLHFPEARIVRMDLDTTLRKGAHEQILRDFRQGEYDILLGTQMVAKGLDFPKVTLVGVISADVTLLIPDFRSSERTFQLLTQVAGRSGRKGKQGEVIIQTYSPNNHSIRFAQKHDFLRFYAKEIAERRELLYPPFGRLIEIEFKGEDEKQVLQIAKQFTTFLNSESHFYHLLGPSPAPLSKIKGEYRYHLILKNDKRADPSGKKMREELHRVWTEFQRHLRHHTVHGIIDVDPLELV